ncbi:PREDICTED: uncharacterized protein LOC108364631 [Rhagoletis zephyria]|uniref:uncharacterized protein LOC108364631 n=1 Tax=Rhagoletis zephyria TaxID=28612 RepID=UPI0008116151|nr:PREDICTED: uncharacterized protein LOC108364631 [Rhagoletis zephyria]
MHNNQDVAKGMGNFGSSKKIWAELWEKFGPPMRNGREWNKVWLDYKQKLKKKISTNRRETVATGGGPYYAFFLRRRMNDSGGPRKHSFKCVEEAVRGARSSLPKVSGIEKRLE